MWQPGLPLAGRKPSELRVEANPRDAQLHALLGTALAYLGRRDEAIEVGKQAVAMMPVSKDAYFGANLEHQLARI